MELSNTISPSMLVNLFANSMPSHFMERPHRVRGEYIAGKGVCYQGMYYDLMKDEASEGSISLVVPGAIRVQLTEGQLIEVIGYLNRRVTNTGARIELQLAVTDLISNEAGTIDEAHIRQFEVLEKKAAKGFRDVDGFIKSAILEDRKLFIEVIMGKSGIIDSDITHQMKDATGFYDLRFNRVNLSNEYELTSAMKNSKADIVVVSRGGGDRLEIFDYVPIAEAALEIQKPFVTAIGHAKDILLLQRIADKGFITPTAFGQYLNEMYNLTIEEKSKSKGRAVEEATEHLRKLFQKELDTSNESLRVLKEQLLREQELHRKELAIAKENIVIERRPSIVLIIVLVLISIVAGGIAMYFILRK